MLANFFLLLIFSPIFFQLIPRRFTIRHCRGRFGEAKCKVSGDWLFFFPYLISSAFLCILIPFCCFFCIINFKMCITILLNAWEKLVKLTKLCLLSEIHNKGLLYMIFLFMKLWNVDQLSQWWAYLLINKWHNCIRGVL